MLRAILFFAIMTIGLICAVWSRFAALLLYVWFALFRPQEWVWFDITSLRLSLVTGLMLVVPCLLTGILPDVTHPLSIASLLFLLSGVIAHFNAIRPDVSWLWLDFLFRLILVSLLAITLVNSRQRFIMLMGVIAVSFGFHTAKAGLASLLGGGVRFFEGVGGAFTDNNAYALATVMILPFLIATGQNCQRTWLKLGFYAAVPLSILTVVSLFSRGAFLALAAAAAVFALSQRRKVATVALLVGFLGVGLIFAPIPKGYFSRLETISTFEQVKDVSALGRLHFWRVAIDMAYANPLGVGLKNYEWAYNRYDTSGGAYGSNRAAHSSFFEVLATQGFPGAIIYVAMFFIAFRRTFRIRKRAMGLVTPDERRFLHTTSVALIASMTAFLVGGSFISMSLNDLSWLTFALVASLDRISANAMGASSPNAATEPEEAPPWAEKRRIHAAVS